MLYVLHALHGTLYAACGSSAARSRGSVPRRFAVHSLASVPLQTLSHKFFDEIRGCENPPDLFRFTCTLPLRRAHTHPRAAHVYTPIHPSTQPRTRSQQLRSVLSHTAKAFIPSMPKRDS